MPKVNRTPNRTFGRYLIELLVERQKDVDWLKGTLKVDDSLIDAIIRGDVHPSKELINIIGVVLMLPNSQLEELQERARHSEYTYAIDAKNLSSEQRKTTMYFQDIIQNLTDEQCHGIMCGLVAINSGIWRIK